MGRMKEIYIEVINRYGEIPDGFSLAEYNLKKKMEELEQQELEEKLKQEKDDQKESN